MSGPYENLYLRTEDGETVAGLKDGRITGAYRPMVCVGSEKYQKSEIKRLWEISQHIYYMDFLIDGELSEISKFLLSQGYKARPVYTQIIDLTKTEEHLHADLRKSYKSLCNSQNWYILTPEIVFNNDYFDSFVDLHQSNHKKYRGYKTWDMQAQMIEQGEAILCISRDEMDRVNAGVMMYFREGQAYYACSASKENVHTHHLIWQSMLWLKRQRSIVRLDMGEQVYSHQWMMNGQPATDKNCNISMFKNGFGGATKLRLILEK